jgi:hypothetical protein
MFLFGLFFLNNKRAAPIAPPSSAGAEGTKIFLYGVDICSFPIHAEFNAHPPEIIKF